MPTAKRRQVHSASHRGSSGYDGRRNCPGDGCHRHGGYTRAGAVINVNAGGDLQSALNSAQCGKPSNFKPAQLQRLVTLPARIATTTIGSSSAPALPTGSAAEGQRVTPCYGASVPSKDARLQLPNPQNVLAKVQMPNPDGGPFSLANGANFYRLVGLELTRPIGVKGSAVLISIEDKGDVREPPTTSLLIAPGCMDRRRTKPALA